MRAWELRPRQPLAAVAICATIGVALSDAWPAHAMYGLAGSGVLLLLVLWRPSTWLCLLLSACTFFTLHNLRHYHSAARQLAAEFSENRHVVAATAVVVSEPDKPTFWSKNITCYFRVRVEALEFGGVKQRGGQLLNVSWAGEIPSFGDRVTITGTASNLEERRNPGQFDSTNYLRRQGVYSQIRARYPEDCRIVGHGNANPIQAFGFRARAWMQRQLALDLEDSPEIAALIQSMVLGLRGDTPDHARELFQRTGTLHLFAVSGLNVAMLAAIALFVLKPTRLGRGPALFVIIPILLAYALVTGLSSSCVRATIMGSLLLLGHVFDRRAVACNSLAAAALLILAWDTNQLFSPGFQFSFVLVLAIIWLAPRIQRPVRDVFQPDDFLPRPLWGWHRRVGFLAWDRLAMAIGVTLAAWIGSLAFTAGYFHLFSPVAIIANLVAVLLAFAILGLGLLTVLTTGFLPWAAVLFSNANWLFATMLLGIVEMFAMVPGGHLYLELPYGRTTPDWQMTVLDVEDGGATHLRVDGQDWLIDCGSRNTYERIVLPYLRTRGVNRLDGFIATHGDAQHLGGAISLLDDFHPRLIGESAVRDRSSSRTKLHTELAQRRWGKTICRRGDELLTHPPAKLRVLFPPAGLKRAVADDKALVMQLECNGVRVLFMSDSGFTTEHWLLENEPDLRSDILVKGQHAKDLSGTMEFLNRVEPKLIICTTASFTAPREALDSWEQQVAARGIAVFRQSRTGAVRVEARDGAFEARGFVDDQTFRSRAR